MIGKVARGKARKKGKRMPTTWTAPRFSSRGFDWSFALEGIKEQYVADTEDTESWFMLPDFYPERGGLESVSGFMRRPMLQGRAISLLKELASDYRTGVAQCEIDAIGAHAPRHILPTLAHLSNCTVAERVSLGWSGKGTSSEEDKRAVKEVSLPLWYAAEEPKLRKTAILKMELFGALDIAMQRAAAASSSAHDRAHAEGTGVSWETLVTTWPRREASAELADEQVSKLQQKYDETLLPIEDKGIEESSASTPSDDDEEDSSSDSGATGCDESMYTVQEEKCLTWARARRGQLHRCCENDEGLVEHASTICGRRLVCPVLGVGLEAALGEGCKWSPRCWSALSEDFRELGAAAHVVED